VFPNSAIMARQVADDVAIKLSRAIETHGDASLVVPGGTTPGFFFDALAHADLDWARVTVMPSDERWVPTTDAGSNERLIRERLLVGRAASARFVSWRGAGEDRDSAIAALNARIHPHTSFDVCVLGLGTDGHIASIIPSAPDYAVLCTQIFSPHSVTVVDAPGAAITSHRLSLTLGAILRSQLIVVLSTGEPKRVVLEAAIEGDGDGPIVLLLAPQVAPIWACWAPEVAQ